MKRSLLLGGLLFGMFVKADLPADGIFLRDPHEPEPVNTLNCVTFSPDGTRALVTNARHPDRNFVVDAFDATTGEWLEEMELWPAATLSKGFFIRRREKVFSLWDSLGQSRLPRIGILSQPNLAHWSAQISKNRRQLAVLANFEGLVNDGQNVHSESWVEVYDIPSARRINRFPVAKHEIALAFFPDGQRLITIDKDIAIWNIEKGEILETIDDAELAKIELGNLQSTGLAVSPDGIYFSVSGVLGLERNRFIHVYETKTSKLVYKHNRDQTYDSDPNLGFTPDGLLFTWAAGAQLNYLSTKTFSRQLEPTPPRTVGSISPGLGTGPANCPKVSISPRGDRILFVDNDDELTLKHQFMRERLRLVPTPSDFWQRIHRREGLTETLVNFLLDDLAKEAPSATATMRDLYSGGEVTLLTVKSLFERVKKNGTEKVPQLIAQLDENKSARRALAHSILEEAAVGIHVAEVAAEYKKPRSTEVANTIEHLTYRRKLINDWEVKMLRAIKVVESIGISSRRLRKTAIQTLAAIDKAPVSILLLDEAQCARRRLELWQDPAPPVGKPSP